jgi:hypothetical protein
MVSVVVEHVVENVADLTRRLEDARVVAVGEDLALSVHDPVELLGDADAQPLHAAGERSSVVRFSHQVNVAGFDVEVGDAEAEAILALFQGGLDGAGTTPRSKIPNVVAKAESDVKRISLADLGPAQMRDT